MKCKECKYAKFSNGNGNPNRYYCVHPKASQLRGDPASCLICKTERHSKEFKIKTSPKWCPFKTA